MTLRAAKQVSTSTAGSASEGEATLDAGAATSAEGEIAPIRVNAGRAGLRRTLQSICVALTSAQTEADMQRILLEEGGPAVRPWNAAFWRLQDDGLVLQGSRGYSSEFVSQYTKISIDSNLPIATVARTGEPRWFASRAEYVRAYSEAGAPPVALACLPLRIRGRCSGVIAFSFRHERGFGAEERRLLLLLAAQCSQALEHGRLFEAESRARSRIGRMQEVTAAFSRASTAEEVAEVACRIGGEAVDARSATLWSVRDDGGLSLTSLWGADPSFVDELRDLSARVLEPVRRFGALWIETEDDYRRVFPESFEKARAAGRLLAWSAIALGTDGRVTGLVCFGHASEHRYDADERSFCVALAQHCAQALDRARLLDAERRSNNRLRLLAAAGEAFSVSMDYESTLYCVVGLAMPLLADYGYFDIVDGDCVHRVAYAYEDPQTALELRRSPRPRLEAREMKVDALTTGRAGFYPRVDEAWMCQVATSAVHLDAMRRHALSSLITVPLSSRGELAGALTLCYGKTKRHHAREDVALAEELAFRATIAIEQSRLYRHAQDAARRAEDANRVKDEFLATVSHELRTPLNAISGWSSLLVQRIGEPAAAKKAVEVIRRNVQAQTQIVEDILDMSRIMTGKLTLDSEPVDVLSVVRDALDVVRPSADAKGVAMTFVEPPSEPCLLVGDARRLQQVAWNLLSNAVKFTDGGGSVQVRVRQEGPQIVLTVDDTGRGIDPRFLPHVFERFKQGDSSTTREFGGLGLGLAIVRHIVELHGGRALAHSQGAGKGSTFQVVLPVRAVLPAALQTRTGGSRASQPPTARASLASLRVLVVDDEPEARELIEEVLVTVEAVVETASCVRNAISAMRHFRPDVVVTDIGMPGEDGYSLLRAVRARPREDGGDVPVLALTAFAHTEDRLRIRAAGFDDHLSKPVEPGRLIALISKLARAH